MTHRSHAVARLAAALGLMGSVYAGGLDAQPRGDDGRTRGAAGRTAEERAQLERRFEERLAGIVQRELRTTPEQTQRLSAVSRRFEQQRRPLFQREMALRRELRRQLGTAAPDERRVEGAMRELLQLQRRRIDLIEAEQQALAGFLTPVQRARYLALQENLRHRVEQRGREGRARASAPGGPPPGLRR